MYSGNCTGQVTFQLKSFDFQMQEEYFFENPFCDFSYLYRVHPLDGLVLSIELLQSILIRKMT